MNKSKLADSMLPVSCDLSLPYVYLLWEFNEVVYVGQSFNVKQRIQSHLTANDKTFDSVSLIECCAEDISIVEISNIKTLTPKYNKNDNPCYKKHSEITGTECKELRTIVRDAAEDMGIMGVMALDKLCTELTYERVSRVWHGNTSAKFCDVEYVLNILNVKVRWSK